MLEYRRKSETISDKKIAAASIAQWLEHWSCKPGVRSSTLRGGLCPIKHFNIFLISIKN